ncbi:MAG: Hsp20/alpha crystallin family protein [Haloplanus sp.]
MQPINDTSDFDDLFERMSRNFGFGTQGRRSDAEFPIDVVRHDDELVVTADVPGFESAAFDVSVDGDLLTIRAESDSETDAEDAEGAYVRRERRHRAVRRTIRLPVDVDGEGASATYRNGVLTVSIPVETDDDGVRHIDVE